MSLEGTAKAGQILKGQINKCDTLVLSAYAVAVKNGFEGTEEEWVESLKPRKGVDYFTEEDIQQIVKACLEALPAAEGVKY